MGSDRAPAAPKRRFIVELPVDDEHQDVIAALEEAPEIKQYVVDAVRAQLKRRRKGKKG